MQQKGGYSDERLRHFQCHACQKWWSIGDAPEKKFWFCPWCGEKQEFEEQHGGVAK